MTTESMREKLEAWYDAFEFRRDCDKYGPSAVAFQIWKAATLAERERCAKVCEGRYAVDNSPEYMEAAWCADAIRKGE